MARVITVLAVAIGLSLGSVGALSLAQEGQEPTAARQVDEREPIAMFLVERRTGTIDWDMYSSTLFTDYITEAYPIPGQESCYRQVLRITSPSGRSMVPPLPADIAPENHASILFEIRLLVGDQGSTLLTSTNCREGPFASNWVRVGEGGADLRPAAIGLRTAVQSMDAVLRGETTLGQWTIEVPDYVSENEADRELFNSFVEAARSSVWRVAYEEETGLATVLSGPSNCPVEVVVPLGGYSFTRMSAFREGVPPIRVSRQTCATHSVSERYDSEPPTP